MKKTPIDIFNQYASYYQEQLSDVHKYDEIIKVFVKHLPKNASVLDIGCGPGNFVHALLTNDRSLHVKGIDGSEKMIEIARSVNPTATFEVKNVVGLELDEIYNGIVCTFLLPYLRFEEGEQLIGDISRSVKPKGVLLISTMIEDSPSRQETTNNKGDSLTSTYYSEEQLRNILETYGFHINASYTFPSSKEETDLFLIAVKN